jgi:hypothetical protein
MSDDHNHTNNQYPLDHRPRRRKPLSPVERERQAAQKRRREDHQRER